MHIGNKIRHFIDAQGLNKKKLAKEIATSEQNLHKMLAKPHIRTDKLLKFCELLHLHPKVFFTDYDIDMKLTTSSEPIEEYLSGAKDKEIIKKIDELYKKIIDAKDEQIRSIASQLATLEGKSQKK